MSKPASNKVLEKALTAELEGLQKIHVAVAKQITRLQHEEAVLKELLEQAKAESAQQEYPAVQAASSPAQDEANQQ
ncbi:g8970 [Coccomyxa viridis]|uniref:G8970 protein n=1 Tax=Coccomyxa viridis TaxID=1274662 RepID=A0ABP1G815_9CHLO